MTFRLVLSKKDPLHTDFLDTEGAVLYTSDTVYHLRPLYGSRATTTVTRKDPVGERWQVGVIEWPVNYKARPQVVVGTRSVEMTKTGLYTSPEKFIAVDGQAYEWQIRDSRPQLVPLRAHHSSAYIATFVQNRTGSFLMRKHSASLFIPPEGGHILDDIVVTFIYFESQWRDRERTKARSLSRSVT
ncbi:hypothetical protein HYDPIDRAFT_92594 [Hydnomerulius pinastri MD-312]|uniref:Unplaced genomic scaffold scaffold_17, whole genome shotgun sequence n=1 Tax=Hydnomerulius pinastri MD-312 TaxID=994086 RepID=A0A0C9W7U4_9AGAM|nr:hypothetical protein HYDPIDRAFT_92594 [Hydnomerulius pinastri MD-312]